MAVKIFKQRTSRDNMLSSSSHISQSMKDLSKKPATGPGTNLTPEPTCRTPRKSGSPIPATKKQSLSPQLKTARSLDSLPTRPRSAEITANFSIERNSNDSSGPNPPPGPRQAPNLLLGGTVPQNPTMNASPQIQAFSIPPLMCYSPYITVAKLDEITRRGNLMYSGAQYPLRIPMTPATASDRKTPVLLPPIGQPATAFSCKFCHFKTLSKLELENHALSHFPPPRVSPNPAQSQTQFSPRAAAEEHLNKLFGVKVEPQSTSSPVHFTIGSFSPGVSHYSDVSGHNTTPSDESVITVDSGMGEETNTFTFASNGFGQQVSKPFKCSLCPYSTIYENCLKSHEARHSAEFEEILQSSQLSDMKVGTGYKCSICQNYSTAYKKCLASHLLKHKKGISFKHFRQRVMSKSSNNSRSSSAQSVSDAGKRLTSESSFNLSDDESPMEPGNAGLAVTEELEEPCSKRLFISTSQDMEVDDSSEASGRQSEQSDIAMGEVDSCGHCETFFKNKDLLRLHLSFHTAEHPYKCARCGFVCADSFHFNQHLVLAPHK